MAVDTPRPVFTVLIVGCGLSGLASALALAQAGHRVIVFERSVKLQEIGAGIQLSPNATRLLQHWGVFDEVAKYADKPAYGTFRAHHGEIVSSSPPVNHPVLTNPSPYIVIHRADLLHALESATSSQSLDIEIKLSSDVKSIDFTAPSITLSTGETFTGDFILAGDGERSRSRAALLGKPEDPPYSPGDVVYRISVPTNSVLQDPSHPAYELASKSSVNFWMGKGGHVVEYPIQHDMLNIVLVYHQGPDSTKVMYGPQKCSIEEFKTKVEGWDPVLHSLIDVEGSVCTKWTLFQIYEQKSWLDERQEGGKFALIGDAAHAMLPCLAQGAAQAFEDAGVLGGIFSHPITREQIPDALQVFDAVRRPRASQVRHRTLYQKAMFALPDGKDQEERDAMLRSGGDYDLFEWLWGFDAAQAGREAWEEWVRDGKVPAPVEAPTYGLGLKVNTNTAPAVVEHVKAGGYENGNGVGVAARI